jgi:hypothetical protein
LFDLEGHSGAIVGHLGFSPDGNTLVTADDQRRLYGWLSRDRLGGVARGSTVAEEVPSVSLADQPAVTASHQP